MFLKKDRLYSSTSGLIYRIFCKLCKNTRPRTENTDNEEADDNPKRIHTVT